MSNEKEHKKRIVTELKHPLPDKNISFESHFDIISAYVVASGKGKNEVGSSRQRVLDGRSEAESQRTGRAAGCSEFRGVRSRSEPHDTRMHLCESMIFIVFSGN